MTGRRTAAVLTVAMTLLVVAAPLAGLPTVSTGDTQTPPGMATVPDGQINSNIPQHARNKLPEAAAFRGKTLSNAHAASLSVELTTAGVVQGRSAACSRPNPPKHCDDLQLALNFTDNQHHDGRTVAVPANALVDALDYRPETAYGRHENGTKWTSTIRYEDGYATWRIPHFSTNTVTFNGVISIQGQPAGDGSQFTYNLSDYNSVSNFTIAVEGSTATEWDNETTTGVGLNDSVSISPAGNINPAGPTNNNPVVKVTALGTQQTEYNGNEASQLDLGGETGVSYPITSKFRIDNPPGHIDQVTIDVKSVDASPGSTDVYIVERDNNGNQTSETLVKAGVDLSSLTTGNNTLAFDTSVQPAEDTIWVEFRQQNRGSDGDKVTVHASQQKSSGDWYSRTADGTTKSSDTGAVWVSGSSPDDVEVSADDGTTVSLGSIAVGETATAEFPLSTAATTINLTAANGAGGVDVTVEMQEQTQTADPSIETNGQWANYSGSLSDGTRKTLTTDTSWLQNGTNRVNVSVGDGTLGADAPQPQVRLDYDLNASTEKSVSYTAEKWTEAYNISRTYPSEREQANFSIPFQSTVLEIRSIEYRINESGGWNSVAASNYALDGTTLTVDIDGVYGGQISSRTVVEVRADGSKVQVNNGSITVDKPTTSGQRLDTKLTVDSWASDSYIALNDTDDSARIHYTYNESWTGSDEYMRYTASGTRHLHLPNVNQGGTTRVSTIPVSVNPQSGEVLIEVEDPQTIEPVFYVRPGATDGDTVKYTFEDASDGKKYILYSTSNDVVRESGTASSPLTLEDDDSEETLQFQLDSSATSEGGGGAGGGGGVFASPIQSSPLNSLPAVLIAFVAVNAIVYYIDRGRQSIRIPVVGRRVAIPGGGGILFVLTFFASGLLVLNYLSEGIIGQATAGVIASVGESVGPLAGIVGVGLTAWYLYRRFIRGQETTIVVEGERR